MEHLFGLRFGDAYGFPHEAPILFGFAHSRHFGNGSAVDGFEQFAYEMAYFLLGTVAAFDLDRQCGVVEYASAYHEILNLRESSGQVLIVFQSADVAVVDYFVFEHGSGFCKSIFVGCAAVLLFSYAGVYGDGMKGIVVQDGDNVENFGVFEIAQPHLDRQGRSLKLRKTAVQRHTRQR